MNDILDVFDNNKKTEAFSHINSKLTHEKALKITGMSIGAMAPISAHILNEKKQGMIIASTMEKAKKLSNDIAFFSDKKIFLLPEDNDLGLRYEAKSHEQLQQRLKALISLINEENCIVIITPRGCLKRLLPQKTFLNSVFPIKIGNDLDLSIIREKLIFLGYEYSDLVEEPGQFTIRGGIMDVFSMNDENPCRVEFFDTQIDSIRNFDVVTQRSINTLTEYTIFPAQLILHDRKIFRDAFAQYGKDVDLYFDDEKKVKGTYLLSVLENMETITNTQILENYLHYFYNNTESIFDYLSKDSVIICDEPERIEGILDDYEVEFNDRFETLLSRREVIPKDYECVFKKNIISESCSMKKTFLFSLLEKTSEDFFTDYESIQLNCKAIPNFNGNMKEFGEWARKRQKEKYKLIIFCGSEHRKDNLIDFCYYNKIESHLIKFIIGGIWAGVEFLDSKIAIVSDAEIFAQTKIRKGIEKRKDAAPIKIFTDLKQGDYIVHENHGIGKFEEIEQLTIQNVTKDYLKIKYAGEDVLFVPVAQMDLIQKYIGADGIVPKIYKLSGTEWRNTKAKAKIAIKEMAKEILEVSASRKAMEGHSFSMDTEWQKEFEDLFPYVETYDQLQSVKEIKEDMEKSEIMDRLLCGDVGYGKTEVTARAVFKCVNDGKQAAILVPTTILASQHFHTFTQRFSKFPIKIEMLSRFRTEKQQQNIIERLKIGEIDVIIGTHRLLSTDVKYKDVGLLVIDEEHRFGVVHKEKIKQIKKTVDVLTLTATPIPRTLHMSLSGLRDMSIISEPPEERYPIQTYVTEQDHNIIRDAIMREISRKGQVFVVYNKVKGIQKITNMIKDIVPEATVAYGHGQMNEKDLENIMLDFMEGHTQVLVSTTIIESGIDIQNANTMIIIDADKFGLSQLYQLRGRVGRSNKIAYAYLFYQKGKLITEVAEKRLNAIKEFTEFGSGFKIAMRDLEIRGAGNLLGTQQHGHILSIGYELYCKLLEDAVKGISEKENYYDKEDEVSVSIDLSVSAYISNKYIFDEISKLQMYKKIASIKNEYDEYEIRDELIDRYGDMPKETENLINVAAIKSNSILIGVERIFEHKNKIVYEFSENASLNPKSLAEIFASYGNNVNIHGVKKPRIYHLINKKKEMLSEIKEMTKKIFVAL